MPLLLIFRTHNFWIKETVIYEQPQVTHLNEMIVIVYTDAMTYTFGST
jgi:hypothetical protein